jgi:hypothetical protein
MAISFLPMIESTNPIGLQAGGSIRQRSVESIHGFLMGVDDGQVLAAQALSSAFPALCEKAVNSAFDASPFR